MGWDLLQRSINMSPGKLLMWCIWKWKQAPYATKWQVYTVNTCIWVIYSPPIGKELCILFMSTPALKNINSHSVIIIIQLNKNILAESASVLHFSHLTKLSNSGKLLILAVRQTTSSAFVWWKSSSLHVWVLKKINASSHGRKTVKLFTKHSSTTNIIFVLIGEKLKTCKRLMNNQMSLTCFWCPLWLKGIILQLFDVQLLLSHQLHYFKAVRNNQTKISQHKTNGSLKEYLFSYQERSFVQINYLDFMTQLC